MSWQDAIERTVTGLGYELVDTERSAGGLLRVYIDKQADASSTRAAVYAAAAPGGSPFITVEDCERVTRQLQHVLEVEACAYERLEVSSPGLDRPLKKQGDYARFVGEQITLTLKLPLQGRKKYQGLLQAGDQPAGGGWRLVFGPPSAQQVLDFSLDEVKEARVVPVLDFKGRRFAAPPAGEPASGLVVSAEPTPTARDAELDGDHKQ